ncbi:hypothetical protein B7463_g321, partial [Scytalidium lignicola]
MSLDPPTYLFSLQNNIRGRPIPWEGAVRAGTISEDQLSKIRAVDKVRKEQRKQTIEADLGGYRTLFLGGDNKPSVFEAAARRADVVQYLLVLLGDLLDSIPDLSKALSEHPNPFKSFIPLLAQPTSPEDTIPLLTSTVLTTLIAASPSSSIQTKSALPKLYSYLSLLAKSTDGGLQDIAVLQYSALLRGKESRQIFWAQRNETVVPLIDILKAASNVNTNGDSASTLFSGSSTPRGGPEGSLGGGVGLQLLYHVLLVIWQLSFEGVVVGEGLESEYEFIFLYTQLLKLSPKEKTTRLLISTLYNLLSSDQKILLPAATLARLPALLQNLNGRHLTDPDLLEDVQNLTEMLDEYTKTQTNFDEYYAEVNTGHLRWSPPHRSPTFWAENARRILEHENGELPRKLAEIMSKPWDNDKQVLAIACNDVGWLVKEVPEKRYQLEKLGLKRRVMELMAESDETVRWESLNALGGWLNYLIISPFIPSLACKFHILNNNFNSPSMKRFRAVKSLGDVTIARTPPTLTSRPLSIAVSRSFGSIYINSVSRTTKLDLRRFSSPLAISHLVRYASSSSSNEALRKTPLYDLHIANGGKMVPFGGHHMPVQYSSLSIGDSHRFTRSHASLFDVSHMVQHHFSGPGATAFLERVTPAALKTLPAHHSTLSTLLWPITGGIVDDTIVTRLEPELFYVVTNADCREKDLKYFAEQLKEFKEQGGEKVEWNILEGQGLVALQGPLAEEILRSVMADPNEVNLKELFFGQSAFITIRLSNGQLSSPLHVSRGGYTGEDGFEISIKPEETVAVTKTLLETATPERLQLAGLGARDSLRLEAGMCLYGHDLDDTTTPVEGSLSWVVGKERRKDGGFHGDEVILKQLVPKSKGGSGVERRRVGLIVEGAPAREGTEIINENGEKIGHITSGCPSPTLGKNIAIAYIKDGFHKNGTPVEVVVRGKKRKAQVAKMPFVPSKFWKGDAKA